MAYLSDRLQNFLQHGGQISIIVGIDLHNTTREGLQALLELERHGQSETFVYHNEAGSIFHPKLYLFRNEEEARLIVGSNNITESGLYVNVEAGLQVDTEVNAAVIIQTLDALSSWKDTTDRLVARLDPDFLARLSENGYVPDEAAARARIGRESTRGTRRAPPLFASRSFCTTGRRSQEITGPEGAWCRRATCLGSAGSRNESRSRDGPSDAFEKGFRNGSSYSDADTVSRYRYFFQGRDAGPKCAFGRSTRHQTGFRKREPEYNQIGNSRNERLRAASCSLRKDAAGHHVSSLRCRITTGKPNHDEPPRRTA